MEESLFYATLIRTCSGHSHAAKLTDVEVRHLTGTSRSDDPIQEHNSFPLATMIRLKAQDEQSATYIAPNAIESVAIQPCSEHAIVVLEGHQMVVHEPAAT